MGRLTALVLLVASGCSGSGLAAASSCRYSFTAPQASSGESQRCVLQQDAQRTAFALDDLVAITIADSSSAGQARLEAADSHRAELGFAGERYGLTTVDYAAEKCSSWAGHVFWNVTADAWHVEAVGTSGCDGFTFAASFDSL